MPFVTSDDVKALQLAIGTEVNGLDAAFIRCLPKLLSAPDQSTQLRGEWQDMKHRAFVFVGVSPSTLRAAAQMNEGQQIQRDLQPWHARLSALCENVPQAPAPPPAAADVVSTVADTVKWALLAFVAYELFARR